MNHLVCAPTIFYKPPLLLDNLRHQERQSLPLLQVRFSQLEHRLLLVRQKALKLYLRPYVFVLQDKAVQRAAPFAH